MKILLISLNKKIFRNKIPIQYDVVCQAKLIVKEIAEILSVHRRLSIDLNTAAFKIALNLQIIQIKKNTQKILPDKTAFNCFEFLA